MENRLKEMLAERGLTVSEFARQTGIIQPTLHRIVNNRVNLSSITAVNFLRIAHGLGLSAEELYFGDTSYDERKNRIDRVYATTNNAGRDAMLANAIGVEASFAKEFDTILPPVGTKTI